jgi:D-xylose 1-dehydrogenase (NADP+, D-xylono-1,5-lactone-forming)
MTHVRRQSVRTCRNKVLTHLLVDIMSPADPNNVRFKPELSGGSLYDMGCYAVSASRMIFSSESKRPLIRFDLDPAFNVDRAARGVLEFETGSAFISSNFAANGQGLYSIIGTKGVIDVPCALLPGLGSRAAEAIITVIDADSNRKEERLASANLMP